MCGQLHDELPDIGSDKPAQWWDVPEQERDERIELSSDTCVIDGQLFFIRGVIQIPIRRFDERRVVWIQVEDSVGNVSPPYPVFARRPPDICLPLVAR